MTVSIKFFEYLCFQQMLSNHLDRVICDYAIKGLINELIYHNKNMQTMEKTLDISIQNFWLQASFLPNFASLTLYRLSDPPSPQFKLHCQIDIGLQFSNTSCFSNGLQLLQFMRSSDNFSFNEDSRMMKLKYEMVAKNFRKNLSFQLQFLEKPLTEVDQLRIQNYKLKQMLHQYEQQPPHSNNSIEKEKNNDQSKDQQKIKENEPEFSNQINPYIIPFHQESSQSKKISVPKNKRGRPKGACRGNNNSKMRKKKPIKKFSNQIKCRSGIKGRTKNSLNLKSMDPQSSTLIQKPTAQYIKTVLSTYENSDPDKVKLEFQNGDSYIGRVFNDIYHGYGIYRSASGSFYEGEWKYGIAEGRGMSIDQQGNKYIGQFLNDRRHGEGRQIYLNGEKYEGSFKYDYKWGFGRYTYKNGDYYEGQWQQNMCEGVGKEVFIDGSQYEGTWRHDEKNGNFIQIKPNGEKVKQLYQMGSLIEDTKQ